MNISPEAWFFLVLGSIAALTATNAQLPGELHKNVDGVNLD